jgi:hypothetical protein
MGGLNFTEQESLRENQEKISPPNIFKMTKNQIRNDILQRMESDENEDGGAQFQMNWKASNNNLIQNESFIS